MSGYASTFAVSAAVLLGAAFLAFFAARADTTPPGTPNPPQRNTPMTTHAYGAHAAHQPPPPLPLTPHPAGPPAAPLNPAYSHRQTVVSGTDVSSRVALCGLRLNNKKKTKK